MADRGKSDREEPGKLRGTSSATATRIRKPVEQGPRLRRLAKALQDGQLEVSAEQRSFLDDFREKAERKVRGSEGAS